MKPKPKSLELMIGFHRGPEEPNTDNAPRVSMTPRYMAAFHGANDMTVALSLSIPDRMQARLQTNAQQFDKLECKEL